MNKALYIALTAAILTSCGNKPSGQEAESQETTTETPASVEEQTVTVEEPKEETPAQTQESDEEKQTASLKSQMEKMTPIVVKAPASFDGILKPLSGNKNIKLSVISKGENGIVDEDTWYKSYGEYAPCHKKWIGHIQGNDDSFLPFLVMPNTYEDYYFGDFEYHKDYNATIYGPNKFQREMGYDCKIIVETDKEFKTVNKIVDFRNFSEDDEFSTECYTKEGDTIYVSAHNALVAVDGNTGDIIWMSKPKTCNSHFIIIDNSIVCGYGESGGAHYVCVIDKKSGNVTQKFNVLKSPYFFAADGDNLYMRTYSYDYTLKIQR